MPASENLFDVLFSRVQSGELDKQKVCTETGEGKQYSYADLIASSAKYANALVSVGVVEGDRIAVQVDKSVEKLILYLAALRMGAIFLPLNTAYTLNELDFFIGDAQPSLIVCGTSLENSIKAIARKAKVLTLDADGTGSLPASTKEQSDSFETVARAADDLAAILYTSGTTGRSKGAMLSHENLASNVKALYKVWQFSEDDVLLHALPIFHTHGLFVACNLTFFSGASMIFFTKFDADKLLAQMPRATVLMGVPTFYTRLLDHSEFTYELASSMRLFISGSAPMTVEVHKRFTERTDKVVLERYGMTEISMCCSNPCEGERRQGTVGHPLPGVKVRVAHPETGERLNANEVGVLEVKGPNVFKGYWQLPEKTAQEFRDDGFFITGDLVTRSQDGYVTIVGRSKDLIISGGFNVYPKEIEQVLDELEGIKESAVIGVPHPEWGEGVVAAIVPEGESLSEAEMMDILKNNLAAYKLPKRFVYVDELPRNSMAKVQKQVLRNEFKTLFADI